MSAMLVLTRSIFGDIILPLVITFGNIIGVDKMKTNKSQLSKEAIIETTLGLIDENEGLKNVTLRVIAKRLGCAHTNLYNYFSSLDDIFWEALAKALLDMIDNTDIKMSDKNDNDEKLQLVLNGIINFSMQHPGWYRLVWLEPIGGKPSAEIVQILHLPARIFREAISKANDSKFSEEKVNMIAEIMHGYLHGELCKWINNRSFTNDKQEVKVKLLSNVQKLYIKLIN